MMLDIDKGSNVTRPDFPKNVRVAGKSVKTGENWGLKKKQKKPALTILIKSCMKIEEIDTEQQKKPHIKIFTGSPENHEKPMKI